MSEQNVQRNDGLTPILTRRLFVALSVSEPLRQKIFDAVKKMKVTAAKLDFDVKWTRPENYHLTLVFLGDMDEKQIDNLAPALERVARNTSPVAVEVRGFGAFPDDRSARVVWAGVSATKELRGLRSQVAKELGSILGGDSSSDEADVPEFNYLPHITVGRLKNPRSMTKAIDPLRRKDLGEMVASELVLFESKYTNYIATYEPLRRFPLGGDSR